MRIKKYLISDLRNKTRDDLMIIIKEYHELYNHLEQKEKMLKEESKRRYELQHKLEKYHDDLDNYYNEIKYMRKKLKLEINKFLHSSLQVINLTEVAK